MLVGLQGSGKTTSLAKLARWLKTERKRHPLMVSTDVYRPAAMEQLRVLGAQIGMSGGRKPRRPRTRSRSLERAGAMRAKSAASTRLLIDTAGRLQIDDELMDELARLKAALNPHHIDPRRRRDDRPGRGQRRARDFTSGSSFPGVILTKLDCDARGGAALSVRAVTGAPILFAGTGEKLDAFEVFHPDRLASRILGMGDVLTPDRKGPAELRPDQGQGTRAQIQEKRVHASRTLPSRSRRSEDGLAGRSARDDSRAQENRRAGRFRRGQARAQARSRRLSIR